MLTTRVVPHILVRARFLVLRPSESCIQVSLLEYHMRRGIESE